MNTNINDYGGGMLRTPLPQDWFRLNLNAPGRTGGFVENEMVEYDLEPHAEAVAIAVMGFMNRLHIEARCTSERHATDFVRTVMKVLMALNVDYINPNPLLACNRRGGQVVAIYGIEPERPGYVQVYP